MTGNSADDVVADGSAMGLPVALALDSMSNVYVADSTHFFIRAMCFNVDDGGHCDGKTAGNMYRLFGDGTNGDGESNIAGQLTALGNLSYGGMTFSAQGTILRVDSFNSIRNFFKP